MNACSIASDTTGLRQGPMRAFDSVVPNHLFQSEWHGPSRSLKPYSRMVAPYYVFRERIIGPRLPSSGTVAMQVTSSMACSLCLETLQLALFIPHDRVSSDVP